MRHDDTAKSCRMLEDIVVPAMPNKPNNPKLAAEAETGA